MSFEKLRQFRINELEAEIDLLREALEILYTKPHLADREKIGKLIKGDKK